MSAMTPIASGAPMAGMTKNGTTNVPTMAPSVFAASSRPALVAILPLRPATRADEAGKLRPITMVAGRTTSRACENRTPMMPSMRPCWTVYWKGFERTNTTPARARTPITMLVRASRATGCRIHRRTTVKSNRTDRDPGEEHQEDQREDVCVVAAPRREEPRPENLIRERGQAGDERHHERDPGPRVRVCGLVRDPHRFGGGGRRGGLGNAIGRGRSTPTVQDDRGQAREGGTARGHHQCLR